MVAEERITLDKETFRALASDTRVSILKSLLSRRKTLTELAKVLGMSPSSVKEHLDSLVQAGLIEQKDDGHKWKYYELTRKGKSVVSPSEAKIWIMLSISAIGLFFSGLEFMKALSPAQSAISRVGDSAGQSMPSVMESAETALQAQPFPNLQAGLVILFMALLVLSIFLIFYRRN